MTGTPSSDRHPAVLIARTELHRNLAAWSEMGHVTVTRSPVRAAIIAIRCRCVTWCLHQALVIWRGCEFQMRAGTRWDVRHASGDYQPITASTQLQFIRKYIQTPTIIITSLGHLAIVHRRATRRRTRCNAVSSAARWSAARRSDRACTYHPFSRGASLPRGKCSPATKSDGSSAPLGANMQQTRSSERDKISQQSQRGM